jgi:hypothetical protein
VTVTFEPGARTAWYTIRDQSGHRHHTARQDELTGPRGEGYRRMIELSGAPARRTRWGPSGLMAAEGSFITGSDFLMDGVSPHHTGSANSPLNKLS